MVTINIGRKEAVFFGVVILIFVVAGFGIAAYTNPIPDNGHGGENILVDFNGTEMSLQSALDDIAVGGFGGGGGSGGMSFGIPTRVRPGGGGNMLEDTWYQASGDGFVMASGLGSSDYGTIRIWMNSASSKTGAVEMLQQSVYSDGGVILPVPSGWYFRIEMSRGPEAAYNPLPIWWIPTISGGFSCPSGFTKVESSGYVLGCMQNDEQGTGVWDSASLDCFSSHGGRLPSASEWHIAMSNYVFTDETDDIEWNDDVGFGVNNHIGSGSSIGYQDSYGDSNRAYRCWIPA